MRAFAILVATSFSSSGAISRFSIYLEANISQKEASILAELFHEP